jgi:hypothetical protein
MFSHCVIFWTDPGQPHAAEELLAGMEKYLRPIPGWLHFHCGRMQASDRPVVETSYAVGLNLVFPDRSAEVAYQVHPLHVEFIEKVFRPLCTKAVVYDFA